MKLADKIKAISGIEPRSIEYVTGFSNALGKAAELATAHDALMRKLADRCDDLADHADAHTASHLREIAQILRGERQ